MDDEKLIECVRVHEDLYDMSSKKYSDNIHKDKLWLIIGNELNMPGSACKARWISLRDQLRKVLKKNITKTGSAITTKKWKYEECMAFLIPHFKERESKTSIKFPESADEEINNDGAIQQCVAEFSDGSEENDASKPRKRTLSPKKMPVSPPPYKINKIINPSVTASSVLMKNKKSATQQSTSNDDVIDIFFNGLAATVKTFSPEYQHAAKSRLFAVVSDLEWDQLQQKNNSHSAAVSQPLRAPAVKSSGLHQTADATQQADGIDHSR